MLGAKFISKMTLESLLVEGCTGSQFGASVSTLHWLGWIWVCSHLSCPAVTHHASSIRQHVQEVKGSASEHSASRLC